MGLYGTVCAGSQQGGIAFIYEAGVGWWLFFCIVYLALLDDQVKTHA